LAHIGDLAVHPWADALDLKNAGAALFEPDLDHLSLEAILVLASGKFSAEIVEQVLAAAFDPIEWGSLRRGECRTAC
jgi:hypothetical protein